MAKDTFIIISYFFVRTSIYFILFIHFNDHCGYIFIIYSTIYYDFGQDTIDIVKTR